MELTYLVLAMLLAGAFGGLIAGLLGVGGGIVIVPAMEAALAILGIDASVRMHVAVATSLATIVATSISSTYAHYRRNAVDVSVIRRWAPFIVIGSIVGIWISANVDGQVLAAIFAFVAVAVAVKMMLPFDDWQLATTLPSGFIGGFVPVSIGTVSTLIGIGGGSLSVPTMTLCGKPIHIAVGTSAAIGLLIAVPATIGYVVTGWENALLPTASFGYVSSIGFAAIAPTSILFAPIGARLAHRLSRRNLSLIFGLFLFLVAIRMAKNAFWA